MGFGDLDSVSSTSMQDWNFGARTETPAGKTEELFKVETVDEDVPEFFGMIAPWAEKRGRGRPRKLKAE